MWTGSVDNVAQRYATYISLFWDVYDMIWDDSLVGQLTTDNASPTQDQDVGFSAKPFSSSTTTLTMLGTCAVWSSTTALQRRTRTRSRRTKTRNMRTRRVVDNKKQEVEGPGGGEGETRREE